MTKIKAFHEKSKGIWKLVNAKGIDKEIIIDGKHTVRTDLDENEIYELKEELDIIKQYPKDDDNTQKLWEEYINEEIKKLEDFKKIKNKILLIETKNILGQTQTMQCYKTSYNSNMPLNWGTQTKVKMSSALQRELSEEDSLRELAHKPGMGWLEIAAYLICGTIIGGIIGYVLASGGLDGLLSMLPQ